MRVSVVLAGMLCLAACGFQPGPVASSSRLTGPSSAPAPTPSLKPVAAGSAFGVFVEPDGASYSLVLVDVHGQVQAKITAAKPEVYSFTEGAPPAVPLIDLSVDRVYYADGDKIKYLAPDGTTRTVMDYPGNPQTAAGFAVSPDHRRIAVATLSFASASSQHPALDLFVEDVGGGNRVDIFTSTTVTEWPVAWNNGHLVIAVGPPLATIGTTNPYGSSEGYHVVDPATGKRLVTMSNDCLYGPLVISGTACYSGGTVGAQAYSGSRRSFSAADQQTYMALSPDGYTVVGQVAGASIVAFGFLAGESQQPLNHQGNPMGFIDSNRIVFFGPNGYSRQLIDRTTGSAPQAFPIPACACNDQGVYFGGFTSS